MTERPDAAPPPPPIELIGGEVGVRRLIDRFYDLMDTLPEAAGIRALHPADLAESRDKLYWFLVGWLGGRPLYIERFGHPRLRARHLPFPIASDEASQWMLCMRRALAETVADAELRGLLDERFTGIAAHMRNRADS
jgi:hemoglobin